VKLRERQWRGHINELCWAVSSTNDLLLLSCFFYLLILFKICPPAHGMGGKKNMSKIEKREHIGCMYLCHRCLSVSRLPFSRSQATGTSAASLMRYNMYLHILRLFVWSV